MHLHARIAGPSAVIALITAGLAGTAQVAAAASGVVGHVYVNDNTAGTNTVAAVRSARRRNPDGHGGIAVHGRRGGAPERSSDPRVAQATDDGRYLLAVDAGSNQISVLRVRPDGTLRLAHGSPVASGGIEPISIAVHDGLVYVANEGNGVTGSELHGLPAEQRRPPDPARRVDRPVAGNGEPRGHPLQRTGRNLIGIEVGMTDPSTFLLDSFTVGEDGRLSPAVGSPFAAEAAGPFGSEFSPTDPGHLYVSNAHGGAGNGSVSAFSVAEDGALGPIGASPYADGQTAPCWVEISHDGRFLFTVNTGSTTISELRDPGGRFPRAPVGHGVRERPRHPTVRRPVGRRREQPLRRGCGDRRGQRASASTAEPQPSSRPPRRRSRQARRRSASSSRRPRSGVSSRATGRHLADPRSREPPARGPLPSRPRRRPGRRTPRPRRPRGQTPGIVITSLPTVCWFAKSVSAMAASDSCVRSLDRDRELPSSIMEASVPR